ncbi:hypothetical protein [Streptomyces cyaneofuscatus]|uniref:hypothetical protein n=1 Tax=Streptomyces cyaneofuscatus TaxID=66883 RepID=UPI00339EBCB8
MPSADADEDGEDDEEGAAREEAEWLREAVFSSWRGAAKSLHLAATVAADFPWLEGWAEPKFAAKRQRLEALRSQAALFVDPEGLASAAAVAESAASGPEELLTLRLSPVRAESVYRRGGGFVEELDEWTIGVLVACFVEADCADRIFYAPSAGPLGGTAGRRQHAWRVRTP